MALAFAFASFNMDDVVDLTVRFGLDNMLVTVSLVVVFEAGAGDEGDDDDDDIGCAVIGCVISIELRCDAVRFRLVPSPPLVLFSVIEPLWTDSMMGNPLVRGAFAIIGHLSPSIERRS